MTSNSASNARVVLRESQDYSKLHEYTPLTARLINNGRKKPDELTVTLTITNKVNNGDVISYLEDYVELSHCSAIWNFQLSARDERGYEYDPNVYASATITCAGVSVADTVTVNGKVYTAQVAAKGTDYTKFSQAGTNAVDAADLADSINRDNRQGTEPFSIMATVSSNVITVYATPSGVSGNNTPLVSSNGTRLAVTGSGFFTGGVDNDVLASRFNEATAGKFAGNYELDFTGAGQEVTIPAISGLYKDQTGGIIANSINFTKQFDINIWFTPDAVPGSTTPILFSRYNGTNGIEIGLDEDGVTGNWYVFCKLGNGASTTLTGTSQPAHVEGTTDGIPQHIRVSRGSDDVVRIFVMGVEDTTNATKTGSLDILTSPMIFGSDRLGTLDYSGSINQIKLYSGTVLEIEEMRSIIGGKFQPFVMEFAGRVWERHDKSSTKTIKAQSYSKDLNNFKVTLDAITKASLATVSRGAVGGQDAFYAGDQSNTLDQDGTPTGVFLRTVSSITQLYVTGDSTNSVDRYDCDTGSIIKLHTSAFASDSFALGHNTRDISFRNSTMWYELDSTSNLVRRYSMTAWDISTSALSGGSFNHSTQTTSAQGLDVQLTHMIIGAGSNIYEYSLSISWDVGSTVALQNTLAMPSGVTGIVGCRYEINGDYLYAVDSTTKKVYIWTLPTQWDLSTAILQDSFYVGDEIATPQGFDIDVAGGLWFIVLDSLGDNCNRYVMRVAHTLSSANRYSSGAMDEITKDLINNLDPSFIVRTKATMPAEWTGTFLADGTFSEIVNILLVRGSLTFYITPRKILIIEDALENGTKQKTPHEFFQRDDTVNTETTGGLENLGVWTPYKITENIKNDSILVNEITLVGSKNQQGVNITSNKKLVVEGETVHSQRINLPQLNNQTDLDNVADKVITLNQVVQKAYKVEAPMDIHHVRYNHLVKVHNAMLNIDGDIDGFYKVEYIEQFYPQTATIIHVNQYPINFFELSHTETKQVEGLQSDSVVPVVFLPPEGSA